MPDSPSRPDPPPNSSQPGAQSGSQLIERKLATILSADVAEFSRLMNEDEEQTLRTFRGHKKIFESLVLTHHGRVFNTAGDAILAEFPSAVEAVRCATDVQSALRTRNDQLPLTRQVRFRIGINLGDVMIQGQDLLGDGVNLAARLQTAAEPGGICISGSVYDQIRNKLSLAFHSLGERSYKNIPQPVRTFSIVEAESGALLPSPQPKSAWKNPAIWVVAALLIVAGITYAAYVIHLHNEKKEISGTPTPPPTPSAVKSAAATTTATPPATTVSTSPSGSVSTKSPHPGAHAFRFDGIYSGQVCYAKTATKPKYCYDATGMVLRNKLSGHWNVRGEGNLTMHIEGDVQPSGDITILMHSEGPEGARVATINMTGSIRDGLLEAEGKYLAGRPASLNWRLQDSGVTRPAPAAPATATHAGIVRIGGSSFSANGQLAPDYQYTGSCPVDLKFDWGVISTVPTTVTYSFLRNDGGHSSTSQSMDLPNANRSMPIIEGWKLGADTQQFANYRGWVQINIESPNPISQKINFTIHCQ